jgi:c-di-GMP-binding flagellar brake protein YcgR
MLARTQHVVLLLPDRDALPATVEADDARTLTLALAIQPDRPMARYRDQQATVEVVTARGVRRLAGVVDPDAGHPEVLYVHRTGEEDVLQRRDWVRVEAVVPVKVVVTEPRGSAFETTTLNVSGGGLLLRDPAGLELGTVVCVDILPEPGAAPISVAGRVVRRAAAGLAGVSIEHVEREDERRLVRFVIARERHAMRIARNR